MQNFQTLVDFLCELGWRANFICYELLILNNKTFLIKIKWTTIFGGLIIVLIIIK